MAARMDGPPQLLIGREDRYTPSQTGPVGLFTPPTKLTSRVITVTHSHRFFPEIPAVPIEKVKYLFQQILGQLFHKDCRQDLRDTKVSLTFQIEPEALEKTLQTIETLAGRVGLRCERLTPQMFLKVVDRDEVALEILREDWAREPEEVSP